MKRCPSCQSEYDDSAAYCPEDGSALASGSDPLIGRTIANRYRIMQKIGVGGISSVYLARHALIDRFNAIKFLRRDLAADTVHRDRFLREAKAVNRINHPNIVEITDYGESDDGLVYLVMEYVPGDSLASLLSKGPLPALRSIQICEQIASALGRAHQMGVIHRDLKPENILLIGKDQGRDLIKILDFGVAKLVDAPSITGTDQVFGTPGYIAPEMVAGEPIDGRTDLYSLGVMLYEMICGTLPYDWKYPGDLLVKRLTEEPIPPSVRDPSFPPVLEKVVMTVLARQPAARHRDAFHLLEELKAAALKLPKSSDDWTWGQSGTPSGGVQHPKSEPPSMVVAPTVSERESWETGQRDTPVSLPPLAHLVPAPLIHSRDGINAAAWWRYKRDALRLVLEEFPTAGGTPASVSSAMAKIEGGVEELGGLEKRAQAAFGRIAELEEQGRQFRQDLGREIDDVARLVSQRRGEVELLANQREELRNRRDSLEVGRRRSGHPEDAALEATVWEFAAVEERLEVAGGEADEQEYRLSELRSQLGRRNEKLDRALSLARSEVESLARAADGVAAPLSEPFRAILANVSRMTGASERLVELEVMSGERAG